MLTANDEQVLALVADGDPWHGAEHRTRRAGRLATLKRLLRLGVIDQIDGEWLLSTWGRAYLACCRTPAIA